MTPDGFPLVGRVPEISGLILATGMCGQGFMLGPGIGEFLVRVVSENISETDQLILQKFDPARNFESQEILK